MEREKKEKDDDNAKILPIFLLVSLSVVFVMANQAHFLVLVCGHDCKHPICPGGEKRLPHRRLY